MTKTKKTYRSKEAVAFDHGRQLMNYAVSVNRWDWIETLTPILKDLNPEDEDPQRKIPVDPK